MAKKRRSGWISMIAAALVVLTARASLADHYVVPSGSMLPTIEIGDRLIVNKLAFGLRVPGTSHYLFELDDPARGDVVVLSSPEDGVVLLKRVIGLPGERVAVREGRVLINDAPLAIEAESGQLNERIGDKKHRVFLNGGGGRDYGPVEIPKNHYLVLGDNRDNSRDGRTFGLVPRNALLGKGIRLYRHAGEWGWHPLR